MSEARWWSAARDKRTLYLVKFTSTTNLIDKHHSVADSGRTHDCAHSCYLSVPVSSPIVFLWSRLRSEKPVVKPYVSMSKTYKVLVVEKSTEQTCLSLMQLWFLTDTIKYEDHAQLLT